MIKNDFYTMSIKEALSPFIIQVETLISLRQLSSFRPHSEYSLCKACEKVNLAVLKFIATAENIASDYPTICSEMNNACNWSRSLASKIIECTIIPRYEAEAQYNSMGMISCLREIKSPSSNSLDNRLGRTQYSHGTFIQFNEGLMRSIERILLIADWIIVLDTRLAIIKVIQSLNDMDSKCTENFPSFMHMFSRFGTDMVELGEITGHRQLDLSNTQLRCLVALVRSMLEKTTMMILAVWKVNFRLGTRISKTLRDLVFHYTNHLLDLLMAFLMVSHPLYNELSRHFKNESKNQDVEFREKQSQILYDKIFSNDQQYIWEILCKLKELVIVPDVDAGGLDWEMKINQALPLVSDLLNSGQVFTQSSFVSLTERQHVISLFRRLRVQLRSCLESTKVEKGNFATSQARGFVEDICDQIMTAIFNLTTKYSDEILSEAIQIPNELDVTQQQMNKVPSSDTRKPPRSGIFFNYAPEQSSFADEGLLCLVGRDETFQTTVSTKSNSSDLSVIKSKILSVCQLLAHISMSKEISLVCHLTEEFIESLAHMINLSVQIVNDVPTSRHARDLMDVLFDVWMVSITDISNIKNDISDWRRHKNFQQNFPLATINVHSSEIMKNYKLLHSVNKVHSDNHSAFSAPSSPSKNIITQSSNTPGYSIQKGSPNRNVISNHTMHQTLSMNSLDKVKSLGNSLVNNVTESPNPWLSVPEIDKIISMKGRNVVDLASQITTFSLNEGPLKTSIDLMNCVQRFVKEMVDFHAFVERNLMSNHILHELDKLPSLITAICSTQSQVATTKMEIIAKIDSIVELVGHSVTLITALIINWKSEIKHNSKLKSGDIYGSSQYNVRNGIFTPQVAYNRGRFNFDDIPDNKSSFSDTTNTSIFQNSRFSLTRSSSMDKKMERDNL